MVALVETIDHAAETTRAHRIQTAEEFFADLFGDALSPERRLSIFTVPALRTALFASAAEAAEYATAQAAGQETYFGLGLVAGTPAGRGKAEDITAIGGLWADIDLAGPAHPKGRLPASIDEAKSILARMPIAPSLLVDSGHGLHPYWLFKEPWVFDSPAERDRAARLAKGWHGRVCATAEALGWHLENLGDLARVLRVPGTINHKLPGQSATVRIIERKPEIRYNPDDFDEYIVEPETAVAATAGALTLRPDAQPPADKLVAASAASPKFAQTWLRQRPDLPDQSASGYDLALATLAAIQGWSDQEIANLIIAARRQHGDKPEKALRPDYMTRTLGRARQAAAEMPAESPDVDISGITGGADPAELVESPPGEPDPGPLPERLLHVPGFVADVMNYSLDQAFRRQPVLALAGAVALQATLAGRKVCDRLGNRTNLYLICTAPSGFGKDSARSTNQFILEAAGLGELNSSDDFASDTGMLRVVELHPSTLFMTDEVGRMLQTVGDARTPHRYHIATELMKLYSSADKTYKSKAYADSARNISIRQPCVNLYTTTVPENLYDALTVASLQDGFVARFIILEVDDPAPRQRHPRRPPPESLIEQARWWGRFNSAVNLVALNPDPIVVPWTPQAEGRFETLGQIVDAQLQDTGIFRSLWARVEEKACRLALVYACSADRENLRIDAPAAEWACELAEYTTRRMIFLAGQWIADGDFDVKQKRVLRIIRAEGGSIGHNELTRKTQNWKQTDRTDIISNMLATGQILLRSVPTATKPKRCYCLPGSNMESVRTDE